ncbi:EFP [Alphabaculovirus myunipunctae]|uniref:EFP n=1 Tax=Mythimna unipuncta nucleopolyhedrovirus TaxID=447897 RepID=A0A2K9VS40_9ABAC|nr:EFP [Mythimna unipuncta nucleopolyhedrovirus]AUV65270.1 EFP [Mythimna unipuncta nucleopolyhedrovirus]
MCRSVLTTLLLVAVAVMAATATIAGATNLNTTTSSDIVQVTILPSTAGLYFQPVSKLQFVQNTWHFVIEMDHGYVFKQLNELYKSANDLKTFVVENKNCSLSKVIEYQIDNFVLKHIVGLVRQHNEIDEKIPHIIASSGDGDAASNTKMTLVRKRRGINFVGTIYKYLFGIMDNNDAHELHRLANSSNSINSQVKQLTDELIRLTDYVDHIRSVDEYKSSSACTYMDTKLNLICSQLNDIEELYNRLDRAVDSAKMNYLNSLVVTPSRLLNEMSNVSGHLGGLAWPVKLELKNMHVLMDSLVNTHVFLAENRKLLFIIEVPLIHQDIYDLFHTIPLPYCKQKSDKCAILLPDSKYLAVSQDRRGYARYDDTTMCKTVFDTKLCDRPKIVYNTQTAKLCDIRIFMNSSNNIDYDKDCDVRVGRFEDELFYAVTEYNNWLYVMRDEVQMHFVCFQSSTMPQSLSAIALKPGVGLIHASGEENCKINTQKTTLTIHKLRNNLKSIITVAISNKFNISDAVRDIDRLRLASLKTNNDLEHTNLHELTDRLYVLRRNIANNTIYSGADIVDDDDSDAVGGWFSGLFGGVANMWYYVKTSAIVVFMIILTIVIIVAVKRCVDTCESCAKLCGFCFGKKKRGHKSTFQFPDRQMHKRNQKSIGYYDDDDDDDPLSSIELVTTTVREKK